MLGLLPNKRPFVQFQHSYGSSKHVRGPCDGGTEPVVQIHKAQRCHHRCLETAQCDCCFSLISDAEPPLCRMFGWYPIRYRGTAVLGYLTYQLQQCIIMSPVQITKTTPAWLSQRSEPQGRQVTHYLKWCRAPKGCRGEKRIEVPPSVTGRKVCCFSTRDDLEWGHALIRISLGDAQKWGECNMEASSFLTAIRNGSGMAP
jgi:hypothetical protein